MLLQRWQRLSEYRASDSLERVLESGIGCQSLKMESLAWLTPLSRPLLRAEASELHAA